MIKPLHYEKIIDLTGEPLGAGWLRRHPTVNETKEEAGHGVWRTGPKLRFRDALIAGLEGASEIALISSFLLADERLAAAMLEAAKRGVRVYVLTASEKRIGKVVREEDVFEQQMADQHKKLLDSLAGKVLLRSAEHIHAKFLVVDPQDEHARAWLSTANFNKALENSVELGVELDAKGARALATCFNWAFWCEAESELREAGRLMAIKAGYPAAPQRPSDEDIFATLKGGTVLREQLLAMIRSASREILVASYGFEATHLVVRSLIEAAKRGVSVTVITRPRPAVAAGVAALAAAGIQIFGHDKLHAKALVVDGQAIVMSANLESHGLDSGFEVGAVLRSDAAREVEATLRKWTSSFPWSYRADAMRGEHLGDFCPVKAGLRDGVAKVTELHSQSVQPIIADDALSLDAAPAPELNLATKPGEFPQRVKFMWDVLPPQLPQGATQRLKEVVREEVGKDEKLTKTKSRIPYDPPVFDHKGKVFVVLNKPAEIDQARQAAASLGAKVVVS
jgi:cardiolipin synthase